MASVKASLHTTIESLSEKEARQLMELVRFLRDKKAGSRTFTHLALDAAFNVPSKKLITFRTVKPIHGKGIPASKLLVEDRR